MTEYRFDHLDLSAIQYPSSRATVGQILNPVAVKQYKLNDLLEPFEDQFEELHVNIRTEHELAAILYARATGQDHEALIAKLLYDDFENVRSALNSQYMQLGISTGRHQTDELIRNIESQVLSQIPEQQRKI